MLINGIIWTNARAAGGIPSFLNVHDTRPARVQFNENYAHGGGWCSFPGFVRTENAIQYPGDPPREEIARAKLRDETIIIYQGAWVAIVQPDGSFDIARMD